MRNAVYRLIVAVGGGFFRALGLRRTVVGAEHVPASGGAVLAISHFSYLDFALAEWVVWHERRRYTRFMATAAAFRHPLSGPLMRSMRHIPVDRDAGARAYEHALGTLAHGDLVGVFPESRVSGSFTLLPFKTGAARIAQAAGVPILPCVVWGSHRVMTRTHRTRLLAARGTPVVIAFGEPLRAEPGEDPRDATSRLRQAMQELLEEAIDCYPERPEPGAWWVPAHRGGGAPPPEREPGVVGTAEG